LEEVQPYSRWATLPTVDRIEADARTTTYSSVLYLDGKERDYQEPRCSGTQSSRRVDSQTVEIPRKCASGEWTRVVRRSAVQPKELNLDITERHPDGRRFERRLVLTNSRRRDNETESAAGWPRFFRQGLIFAGLNQVNIRVGSAVELPVHR
jgi:hypothetical protein